MLFIGAFIVLVAVFLLGITLMRAGLFILGSKKMEQWLKKMTNTPTKGMVAGIAMTGVLQSSSAVMVIMIGLVSTKLLLFPQTIGIILGSNIGTTLTLQFITFNLTSFIIPFAGIGLICLLFKITWVKSLGFISIGLASIFAAMYGFERLADPLMNIPFMQKLLLMMSEHVLYAFIIGIIITSIIQSSTVVTGIAMSFLNAGIFPLETGILIMLGANIGTCTTALLASIGAGQEARLTAFAHLWLNIGGVLLVWPFISYLAQVSSIISNQTDAQLAHASVIFNCVTSLIVLPFAEHFGRLIAWVHK